MVLEIVNYFSVLLNLGFWVHGQVKLWVCLWGCTTHRSVILQVVPEAEAASENLTLGIQYLLAVHSSPAA